CVIMNKLNKVVNRLRGKRGETSTFSSRRESVAKACAECELDPLEVEPLEVEAPEEGQTDDQEEEHEDEEMQETYPELEEEVQAK
ncbi:hypothetical protein A2U01_0068539, partial [Trifolium medium]|nr:hypothetical protein [Trifolium medium]